MDVPKIPELPRDIVNTQDHQMWFTPSDSFQYPLRLHMRVGEPHHYGSAAGSVRLTRRQAELILTQVEAMLSCPSEAFRPTPESR